MGGNFPGRSARGALSPSFLKRLLVLCYWPALALGTGDAIAPRTELVGIAQLPADSFVPGPVSGQFIDPEGNRTLAGILPFALGQPLQGFSEAVAQGDGSFLVLADNGYGTADNSADFVLTLYRIRPNFRTAQGGDGSIAIESAIRLRDPFKHARFSRVADLEHYPRDGTDLRVDPEIARAALLTGADFDPESLQKMPDGSFWIGDEFGPWLLHFDVVGRLLEPPVSLPDLMSPDNPLLSGAESRVVRSGGFEALALDAGRQLLHAMLEKPLSGETGLLIHSFDLRSGRFADRPPLRYPLDEGARGVGAFQSLGKGRFLAVERDSFQGSKARIKRVYWFEEGAKKGTNESSGPHKTLVADLLDIQDPLGLAGEAGGVYAFSFQTIESLVVLDAEHIALINDNNYPFGNGPGDAPEDGGSEGVPEATVFIVLKVPALKAMLQD